MAYQLLSHKQILYDRPAICIAQNRRTGSFRVRHHTKYITVLITDTGNMPGGPIWIGNSRYFPVFIAIPENNPVICFQLIQRFFISIITALAMSDRYLENNIFRVLNKNVFTDKLLISVSQ